MPVKIMPAVALLLGTALLGLAACAPLPDEDHSLDPTGVYDPEPHYTAIEDEIDLEPGSIERKGYYSGSDDRSGGSYMHHQAVINVEGTVEEGSGERWWITEDSSKTGSGDRWWVSD